MRADAPPAHVDVVPAQRVADPTGVGDAFRAGFLTGLAWELPEPRCAQLGALLATYVVETIGTQEYGTALGGYLRRFADAYGEDAAADVAPHLPTRLRGGG